MKTKIKVIAPEEEERAELFVHKEDREIKSLGRYLELEQFRRGILMCQRGKDICRLSVKEVLYIESIQDVQHIHTEKETYTTKQRLYLLKEELPQSFVRISKSVILNMEKVKEYRPLMGGMMMAEFANGEKTYISRKYLKELREKSRRECYEEAYRGEKRDFEIWDLYGCGFIYRKCNLHRTPKRQGICRNNHAVLWADTFWICGSGRSLFCFLYSERAEGGRIVEILSERHCRSIHNHELYAAVFPCRSCSCRQDACANDFSAGRSGNWWISHLGLQKSVDNVKKA